MKRVFGYVLFVVGAMFVFLGPLLRFYTIPRVEKAPTDVDNTVISNGSGQYFSAQQLKLVGPVPLQSIERFKGNSNASTSSAVVIDYRQHLVDQTTKNDIDYDQEVFAMNRKTGFAEHCCGEKPPHSGLELKFPFGTQKTTYPLWDSSSDRAFPAEFVAAETLNGSTVYHFRQETGPVQLGFLNLPGTVIGKPPGNVSVARVYQATIDAWAEPTTGAIVKGSKHAEQWAELDGTKVLTLADLTVTYTPATVDKLLGDADRAKKQLQLAKNILPLVLPILGLVMVGIGLLLLRGPKEKAPAAVPAPAKLGAS